MLPPRPPSKGDANGSRGRPTTPVPLWHRGTRDILSYIPAVAVPWKGTHRSSEDVFIGWRIEGLMVLGRAKRQSRAHDEGLMIKFSEYIPIPSRICEDFEKDKKTAYNIKKFK